MDMKNRIKVTVLVLFAAFIITALVFYTMTAIHHGEIDYSLIADDRLPLYAKEYASASDGGTTWYKGIGYSVYSVHCLHEENGVKGYLVGPRIRYYLLVFGAKSKESLRFKADANKNP